jgi:RNA polymerase sigma-70 factor (ECF subfamily)
LAIDDLTLVKRSRDGDQTAFKLLVERYQRKVYSVALGMVRDREEARDIAQEAFTKVYKYLDHFKGDSSFYTWLYRITVNICEHWRPGFKAGNESTEESVAQRAGD